MTLKGWPDTMREKVYRDPVHDLITLRKDSHDDQLLMALLDAPEMQRLRRIRQLGLACLAYQGAEHSRFQHALGVMWIATRILEHLGKQIKISPKRATLTRAAALLHDIGHGPLSHVFESFLGVHHEAWTCRMILSKTSAVNRILRGYDRTAPRQVVELLEGRGQPPFLSLIITSQLDADRFDYLLRDSLMTGVKYGIYDLERIIHVLRVTPDGQHITVAAHGQHPVEKYLQARYHMYNQVYLHKTVRAAETILSKLLRRAADLTQQGADIALPSHDPLCRLLNFGGALPLDEYVKIDDDSLFYALKQWSQADDDILRDLSSRILHRRIFKTLNITSTKNLAAKRRAAEDLLRSCGYDPRYYFHIDESHDLPYRPYDRKAEGSSQHILLETGQSSEQYRDIHDVSEVVAGLTRAAYTLRRAVFPDGRPEQKLRERMTDIFAAS